ncbi:MAG: flagellar M-ring protein FliF [Bdellovibrionales bacterium]|nr:flagellar M-ring protein FliF [Bdellovibrionales bacterium]NQZ19274.1 flagellar M-ring protein FliF [Bdellovibrionales bacterium]
MQDFFKTFVAQIREFFGGLTPVKRLSLIASTGVVFAAITTIVFMASGTDYAPLLSNVPPEQVPTVLNILRAKNIPHRIENNSGTVLVPKTYLHSTQMTIMAEVGAGRIGQLGLELFDKQDFGTTSYAQRINYQRALQGELSRAINSLEAVNRSKVILAIPKKKVFLDKGSKPSASVVVELHSGHQLNEEQVRGIVFLVSNSVEDMEVGNVSVVDSKGKILSKKYDPSVAGSAHLMDIKKKVDAHFEERIESILARVVGEGKVIARVNSTLNPQRVTMQQEEVDPDRTAVRSIQTEEETSNGNRSNPTGVPGARANIPGAEEAGRVNFNQNVAREVKTTNYAVPKTIKNIVESAGTISRISVAVMVDGQMRNVTNAEGQTTQEWAPRDEEELQRFQNLVRNVIGFNEGRGDTISMESFKFQEEDFIEADKLVKTIHREKLLRFLASWALAGFGLALIFFLLVKPFIRWVTDSFHDSIEDMLPKTIEELEELHGVDNSLPGMSAAMPVLEEPVDPEKAESEILRERIMAIMDDDEEKASGAFSLWLGRRDF